MSPRTTAAERSIRPRKRPRQARAHETRARIIDAAARVFATRGYASGTTNHIAAEAGLSVGSLYQYFPNKDSILVELTRAHIAAGRDAVAAALAGSGPGLEPRLRAVVHAMLDVHAGGHLLHRVLFEEAPRPRALLEELRAVEDGFVTDAGRVLAEDGTVAVADRDLAAWMVVTIVESVVHRFVVRPDAADRRDELEDELVTLLLAYLRAAPTRR